MSEPRYRANRGRQALALLLCLGLAYCAREQAKPTPVKPPAPAPPPLKPPIPERFRRFEITSQKALLKLRETLGPNRFEEVLKLNRIDLDHAQLGTRLVVPNAAEDWLALAPFPLKWQDVADQPKLLAVSLRLQAWAGFEAGKLVRWGPVSTGRKSTPTYVGLYHTNWCQKARRSTFNDEWELKWYVNLHNWNGISFHQYALPGYPDSHSCVRLAEADSEWIYHWCQSWVLAPDQRQVTHEGTPVIIFGEYAWGAPQPWRRLIEAPSAALLSPAELAEAVTILSGNALPPRFPEPALRSQSPAEENSAVEAP